MMKKHIAVTLASSLALAPVATEAQSLENPYFYPALANLRPARAQRAFPCPAAPTAVRDIQTVSKYGTNGKANNSSVIDPASEATYLSDIAPIKAFSNFIVKRADGYVAEHNTGNSEAECALDWLAAWAGGAAFLGIVNSQGQSVRKWELGTFATTYIKIRSAPLDQRKKARVIEWLHAVGAQVQADFSSDLQLKSRQNNHIFWAAWGVTAAGMASGDRRMIEWGFDRYRQALTEIQDNGALPLEVARRSRAAGYLMFALEPLVMIAEAGEANGVDLYAERGGRLHRLIDLNLSALEDVSIIKRLSGYDQDPLYDEANLAWLEPYFARFHDPRAVKWLEKYRPMSASRIGGNMSQLYQR